MQIDTTNPTFQTAVFTFLLLFGVIVTGKKGSNPYQLGHSHTNELKGLAILMVIFSHIGYFLFLDHRFMYPLSVAGGVGVNLFLFLSGFGLTSSQIKWTKNIPEFYNKRLKKIFIPMWIVLFLTLLADLIFLNKTYSADVIIQNVLGFFPNSDIDTAVNSPLWYFSLILFFYLIFPLTYIKRYPLISAVMVFLASLVVVKSNILPVTPDVLKMYKLHLMAFPLGILFACLHDKFPTVRIETLPKLARYALITFFVSVFCYTAIYSGVGEGISIEQSTSLITMFSLILISLLKNFQSNLLITLGKYSYEIYLIQWPLLYRHDFIYKYTPAFLGTIIYLVVFIAVGSVLNKIYSSGKKPNK